MRPAPHLTAAVRGAAVLAAAAVMMNAACTAHAQMEMPRSLRDSHPESHYIVRMGTGDTPEAASESARFEIAQFFESSIRGSVVVDQWAKSTTVHNKTVESHMAAVTSNVTVSAARDIPGIEIAASGRDDKTGRIAVWAALDRQAYANVLGDRLASFDADIDRLRATGAATDLARMKSLSAIMDKLLRREQARLDLETLKVPGTPPSRVDELYTAMSAIDSLVAGSFDVGVVFDDGVDERVRSGLVKAMVDAGIRVKMYRDQQASAEDGADMVVTMRHDVTHRSNTFRQRVFFTVDWVITLNARDPSTGEVIDALVVSDKAAGAQNEDQAAETMIKRILAPAQLDSMSSWVYDVIFTPRS